MIHSAHRDVDAAKDAGKAALVTYSYDATYRRIKEAPAAGATTDLYYSASWQVIEERLSTHPSAPSTQLVWSPVYVDAMVLRDRDTNADGTLDERLYCLQDANFNVTSTLSTAGAIQERYRYDPYGAVTYLDSSFSSHASAYAWQYLHQGGRLDLTSGLYYFRNRDLNPTLGRWMQEDPLGMVDGDNLYLAYRGNSVTYCDEHGCRVVHFRLTPGLGKGLNDGSWVEWYASWIRGNLEEYNSLEQLLQLIRARIGDHVVRHSLLGGLCGELNCVGDIQIWAHSGISGNVMIDPNIGTVIPGYWFRPQPREQAEIERQHFLQLLETIGAYMCDGASLTIYECDVGDGPDGQRVANELARLIGHRVFLPVGPVGRGIGTPNWIVGNPPGVQPY